MRKIPLCKPYFPRKVVEETLTKIEGVLDSGHLTQGSVVEEFEECAKEYIGCKYAIAVTNCTVGMEIALRALKIGQGDSVVVPAYTHPATHQVIRSVQASPRIVDVIQDTALLDFDKAKKSISSDTKAIIPVSLFGNPLDHSYAEEKFQDIYIIEDAACGLGSSYMNNQTGNFPDIAVFSFHPRKMITTGEGGLITTNDEGIAEEILAYRNFGGYRNRVGTNAKMSDINAAVGVVQFKYLDRLLEKRQSLVRYYNQRFESTVVAPLKVTQQGKHSYQSYVVLVPNACSMIEYMRGQDIEVQVGTKLLGGFNYYPNTAYLNLHALALPLYYEMTREEQDMVVDRLLEGE